MTLIRYNPFREFDPINAHMNRLMNNFYSRPAKKEYVQADFLPNVDISEDEKNIYLETEIPGVSKDAVNVSIDAEKVLTIKGEKKFEKSEKELLCFRQERNYGSFTRSFQLPENVDSEKVEAKYNDGVLLLTIPKIQPVKPKEMNVTIN